MARKPKISAAVPLPPAGTPQPAAKPAAPETRYILNPANGRVFIWNEALASRPDFVECNATGIPLRPLARKLARQAEHEAEERERAQQALGGQTAVTETRDTFGSPTNPAPVTAPAVDNGDLGGDTGDDGEDGA